MLSESAECLWIELMSKLTSNRFTFQLSRVSTVMQPYTVPCLGHSTTVSLSFLKLLVLQKLNQDTTVWLPDKGASCLIT